MSLTVDAALREAGRRLAAAGVPGAPAEARLLLARALGLGMEAVIAHPERPLAPAQRDRFALLVTRRARREPVAQIIGEREFWSLPFRVGPATLTPRPESETLVETALAQLPDRTAPFNLLDLGTGSGCLLLALLSELPQARGLGVDISAGALRIARHNARRLGLAGRAAFRKGDWARGIRARFDLVIANPPYIRTEDIGELEPEVAVHEPTLALDGGADGLGAYRAIAADLRRVLAEGGFAILEIGAGQAEAVSGILADGGLSVLGLKADLAGIPRCVVARSDGGAAAKKRLESSA
ncbi:MAG: peptide chain release factor N(5)-glutamine methyltransferase [Rhodospirillaceae bacterium]|nr:peptide chain release factor N(5)-glutamine methyltransferase [Rhodospirillaceae bacterium]